MNGNIPKYSLEPIWENGQERGSSHHKTNKIFSKNYSRSFTPNTNCVSRRIVITRNLSMGTRLEPRAMIRPAVRTVAPSAGSGLPCGCCCRCFTCLNLGFLTTPPGVFKIAELILGSMCESMLIRFGDGTSKVIGQAYMSLLTSTTAALSTVSLLLICYILSEKSFSLVRSSFFETLFNTSAAFSYLSSSTYLAVMVNIYLYPMYLVTLGFMAYPAMVGAYMMGFALGLLHLADAWSSYRYFKGYR